MTLTGTILREFDQEMPNTRKTLDRVPDGKFDWKPHEKSYSLAGAKFPHVFAPSRLHVNTQHTGKFSHSREYAKNARTTHQLIWPG